MNRDNDPVFDTDAIIEKLDNYKQLEEHEIEYTIGALVLVEELIVNRRKRHK